MEGIAAIAGLPVHLVIAFNTFLDIMMGCTSGTAPLKQTGEILHFRSLDWEMEELRPLVIQVEFIRGGNIVARAVTYAGYTGILTGVRHGLSISLNYRAHRSNRPTSMRLHQILVLMGFQTLYFKRSSRLPALPWAFSILRCATLDLTCHTNQRVLPYL
jgi:hypothetical protein